MPTPEIPPVPPPVAPTPEAGVLTGKSVLDLTGETPVEVFDVTADTSKPPVEGELMPETPETKAPENSEIIEGEFTEADPAVPNPERINIDISAAAEKIKQQKLDDVRERLRKNSSPTLHDL